MTSRLSGASREYTLSLYKQLLSSSKRLPKGKQREDAITDVKRRFRENLHVSDHVKVSEDAMYDVASLMANFSGISTLQRGRARRHYYLYSSILPMPMLSWSP